VWRSGPDRVLLQHVDRPPETAATDLLGDVAYVWLALDTPATCDELAGRLTDADIAVDDVDADLQYLLDHELIEEAVDEHDDG
jgi:hypothetical protein